MKAPYQTSLVLQIWAYFGHIWHKVSLSLFHIIHRYRQVNGSLRKHAYSNVLKILPPENVNFQRKNLIFFHISAQNIDCGYSLERPQRGGSNKYPQSMF